MLESLITSKTRIKLLLKFFLNPGTKSYLREISADFGESSNAFRIELNRLTEAKLLLSEQVGRTVQYRANTTHPLFKDIENVVKKYIGIDQLVEQFFRELTRVQKAFITGDYARGVDSGLIDVVLIGSIGDDVLERITHKTELLINRKIRTLVLNNDEFSDLKKRLLKEDILLLWSKDDQGNNLSETDNLDPGK